MHCTLHIFSKPRANRSEAEAAYELAAEGSRRQVKKVPPANRPTKLEVFLRLDLCPEFRFQNSASKGCRAGVSSAKILTAFSIFSSAQGGAMAKKKACQYGDRCPYIHGELELVVQLSASVLFLQYLYRVSMHFLGDTSLASLACMLTHQN